MHRILRLLTRMLKCLHRFEREAGATVSETYTLILTKGMHVISAAAAAQIKTALSDRVTTVDVELDPFGGFQTLRITTIALQHVVALTMNEAAQQLPMNVAVLAKRASSAR